MTALHHTLIASLLLALAGAAPAQTTTQPAPPKVRKFPHRQVDLTARQITLDATVVLREGQLELLVCKAKSKEHESLLATQAQAAHLHAGLLALGLTAGKAAKYYESPVDGKGMMLPPRGARLNVQLRWKDANGVVQTADPTAWLSTTGNQQNAAMPRHWIFVGSDMLSDGTYWADSDGDVISIANFAAAVIDVPFESSDKNAQLTYQANTAAIPPLTTPVQIVITAVAGEEKAADARATVHINRFGAAQVSGREVPLDSLAQWARKLANDHARCQVVLRCDPYTTAHDIAMVRREIEVGRIFDILVEHPILNAGMLPRTTAQETQTLKNWQDKFAQAQRSVIDPVEESGKTLEQLDQEIRFTRAQLDLLTRYAHQLRQARSEYIATTQPAGAAAPAGASDK
ncbi:MAG: YdjY domain-containing protein [Planctomycetaceae bacterium]|nr:YdjY domain-containing protein [Planctomycetaceae bacterium]